MSIDITIQSIDKCILEQLDELGIKATLTKFDHSEQDNPILLADDITLVSFDERLAEISQAHTPRVTTNFNRRYIDESVKEHRAEIKMNKDCKILQTTVWQTPNGFTYFDGGMYDDLNELVGFAYTDVSDIRKLTVDHPDFKPLMGAQRARVHKTVIEAKGWLNGDTYELLLEQKGREIYRSPIFYSLTSCGLAKRFIVSETISKSIVDIIERTTNYAMNYRL